MTPASWKVTQVRDHLTDGTDFATAVAEMQRAYIKEQRETLLDESFLAWE